MIRRILLSLFFFAWFSFAFADKPQGKIEFVNTEFNFGVFNKSVVRSVVFVFKNTGNAPVVIENTMSSCACTNTMHPRKPILPGKKGYIKVYYNGNKTSDPGKFRKSIDVHSTASNSIVRLFISGETK